MRRVLPSPALLLALAALPLMGAAEPPKLKGSYFVVADKATGPTGYILEVYVNDRLILIHPDGDDQAILKVNAFLEPGRNSIAFKARKGRGVGGSGTHHVQFGEGRINGTVTFTKPIATYSWPNPEAAPASTPIAFTPR